MKKTFTIIGLVFVFLFSSLTYAAQTSEIDAVGCDSENVFNGPIEWAVVANNSDPFDNRINGRSSFAEEGFVQTAGPLHSDPCFGFLGGDYQSALADAFNEAEFTWDIVLQMKPEFDITLELKACIMKPNGFDVWKEIYQTGYYRSPATAELFFFRHANPIIKVKAFPGPYATSGFDSPFLLDTRLTPTLKNKELKNKLLTFNGMWGASLVIKRPQTGKLNKKGKHVYNLKQGDRIQVIVEVPSSNVVDIRFGADGAILKYIGIVNTEYITEDFCDPF